MATCRDLSLVPETTPVILRSPGHVSIDAKSGVPRKFKIPKGPGSLCRRVVALVSHDKRTCRTLVNSGKVRLVRSGEQGWTILLEVPSRKWLPKPFAKRPAWWAAKGAAAAALIGASVLGVAAIAKDRALKKALMEVRTLEHAIETNSRCLAELRKDIVNLETEIAQRNAKIAEDKARESEAERKLATADKEKRDFGVKKELEKQAELLQLRREHEEQLDDLKQQLQKANAKVTELLGEKEERSAEDNQLTGDQLERFHYAYVELTKRATKLAEIVEGLSEQKEDLKILRAREALIVANGVLVAAEDRPTHQMLDHVLHTISLIYAVVGDLFGAVQVFIRIRARKAQTLNRDLLTPRPGSSTPRVEEKADADETGCLDEIRHASARGTLVVMGKDEFSGMPIYDPVAFPDNTKVFNERPANQAVSIRDQVERVADGGSVCMLSFGASGAGKSYLMLSKKDGVLVQSLTLLHGRGLRFKITVFEEAFGQLELTQSGRWRVTDKISMLVGDTPQAFKQLITARIPSKLRIKEQSALTEESRIDEPEDGSIESILDVIDRIQVQRLRLKHIKPTSNNDESSRSHVYFVIRCFDGEGSPKGVLSLVDMAGIESPRELYARMVKLDLEYAYKNRTNEKYFIKGSELAESELKHRLLVEPTNYLTQKGIKLFTDNNGITLVKEINSDGQTKLTRAHYNDMYVRKTKKAARALGQYLPATVLTGYAKAILSEGFFINESLNEMREYLAWRRLSADELAAAERVKRPESLDLTNHAVTAFLNPSVPRNKPQYMQTKNIMRYLDNPLDSEQRTKWVVLVNIRPQARFCNDTLESLNFAKRVSEI